MPLTWSQVRSGLDPQRYTMSSAPVLLAKGRAWRDSFGCERPLKAAMRRLVGRK
jgi:bifunctional non-homologous end joining protein LigD